VVCDPAAADFDPPLRIVGKRDQTITTLEEWRVRASPAGGDDRWREGRSAKEIARAWCEPFPAPPACVIDLLDTEPQTRGLLVGLVRPEARLPLDARRGNTRNADAVAFGAAEGGRRLLSVEAKADESFGSKSVGREVRGAKPGSHIGDRIDDLCELIFGRRFREDGDDASLADLKYQLLHGRGATVLCANAAKVSNAVFLVHELRSDACSAMKLAHTQVDLETFADSVGIPSLPPTGSRRFASRPGRRRSCGSASA
jgi:hypothetical protein